MSQTRKFKADKKYGQQAERLTASRLCSRFGVARNDSRLIAETCIDENWDQDQRGRILIPVEWEWDTGLFLRSPLLDAQSASQADLTCIPLANGGFVEVPTIAFSKLVRRGFRLAKRDQWSPFELVLRQGAGASQETCLAIPADELLRLTGVTGLQNTLMMLAGRAQEANAHLDTSTDARSLPTVTSLPVDAWHTLPLDYPMATRPVAQISKDFDLFVITSLNSEGQIEKTVAAEVKADRRFFETGNVFFELNHKGRPSGVMATTADLFVLVLGGVSITLPTAWFKDRVEAIAASTGPERLRTNASDDGLVEGILLHPAELLVADLNLSGPLLISKSKQGASQSQRFSAKTCEAGPF